MAKLEDAERNERQRDAHPSARTNAEAASDFSSSLQPKEGLLTDSILDALGDEPFEELPPSQCQFQEQILENAKRRRKQLGDKTSTPKSIRRSAETGKERNNGDKTSGHSNSSGSVMDQLKRTMVCNAAAPSSLSRTIMLKEAVVSEEISVAMQAMETVSAEITDLGPFFGLPTKVKDLMLSLKGIKTLYGIITLAFYFYVIKFTHDPGKRKI